MKSEHNFMMWQQKVVTLCHYVRRSRFCVCCSWTIDIMLPLWTSLMPNFVLMAYFNT